MIEVALATEDALGESVGIRLLAEAAALQPTLRFRRGGNGYLRANIDKWCALAHRFPVFLLTDLDRLRCPSKLMDLWLGKRQKHLDFLFRVAVRETEAWLLADHEAMRKLLGNKGRLPFDPDSLLEPKQYLLGLAKFAKKDVRLDLVAEEGAIASQGIGYNARLSAFVATTWSPERAAQRSPSLSRTRIRLRELARRYAGQPFSKTN